MTPLEFMAAAAVFAVAAGAFGSLLGLGGGIIVVPALTLVLGVDIRYAIGASIVSVIATSSGAGAAYLEDRLVNVRVGMFLELGTTIGALVGALVAGLVGGRGLTVLFAGALGAAAVAMWRAPDLAPREPRPDALADRLRLHAASLPGTPGSAGAYRVCRTRLGLAASALAGALSGLLGIGGGILKVPAMNVVMGMPLKSAAATSNFMIGVTAAASAAVYFVRGDIDPFIAGPVALGVLLGTWIGTHLLRRLASRTLRRAFTVVLVGLAARMLIEGLA
jgi:uncharacterized membrane protein YfcA